MEWVKTHSHYFDSPQKVQSSHRKEVPEAGKKAHILPCMLQARSRMNNFIKELVAPSATRAHMTQLIMPQHANSLAITFGGQVQKLSAVVMQLALRNSHPCNVLPQSCTSCISSSCTILLLRPGIAKRLCGAQPEGEKLRRFKLPSLGNCMSEQLICN